MVKEMDCVSSLTDLPYCSSFPHGSISTAGLLVATLSALAATFYSFMSCRYVLIDFRSKLGDFAELFANRGAGNIYVNYRVSAGLFSWLQPIDSSNFKKGECAGYTGAQTNGFGDSTFNTVQYFAVTSVLLSIAVVVWMLFMSCFALGKCQRNTMSIILLVQTILVGLSFMTLQSGLCTNVATESSCKIDQGGLVAVAAVILWFVTFLLSWLFVGPAENELVVVNGEIKNAYAERKEQRKLEREERNALKQATKEAKEATKQAAKEAAKQSTKEAAMQRDAQTEIVPKVDYSAGTVQVFKSRVQTGAADGEMEVFYGKQLSDDDISDTVDL